MVAVGLFNINNFVCSHPENLVRVAKVAEEAGYDSVWTGEHVVLPDPQVPPSPVAPEGRMLNPAVALTFAAAHTTRVKLGTGIIILPQRNPLVLAKELASLDVLSGGRLIFGIGVGYLKPEFDALGVSFAHKGARTEEYLRAMIAIWTMEQPRFEGRFAAFAGVQARPQPVQKPHPEVVFGGHTPEAYSRAARLARGWYGFALDVDATKKSVAGLRAACAKEGRRFEDLEISVTPMPERERLVPDRATAERYAEAGVQRLILYAPRARDEASLLGAIAEVKSGLIGKV